jgi:hypothetical protein
LANEAVPATARTPRGATSPLAASPKGRVREREREREGGAGGAGGAGGKARCSSRAIRSSELIALSSERQTVLSSKVMRTLCVGGLLLLCVGCGDDAHSSGSNPKPDEGLGGESGASGNASAGANESAGGSPVVSENGGASGNVGEDGGAAGEGGSAGEGLLPDEPDNGTLSGTRLKAEWYDFDGTRVFADFYDTELEAPCKPGAFSDGKVYCIPISTATQGYTTKDCDEMLGEISFNSACEHKAPGYLVLQADSWRCGPASGHVYRLAAQPTLLMQYYAPQNGGCAGPFSTGYGNSDTFLVTGEVMPSELVEFTREAPADPGRISRQYIAAADGARLAIAPYDGELTADCSPKVDAADRSKGSCPPTDTRDVVYYTDMDCQKGVVAPLQDCPKPAFTRQLADRSCAQGAANYYKVGDALPRPASVWVGGTTACVTSSVSSQYSVYARGEAVTVQQLTRAHDSIAGRNLQPIYFSDGQKRYLDQNLYDTAHDTECQPYVLPNGTITCVPFGASASAFYEETCTSFIHVGLVYFGLEHCNMPPALPPFIVNPYAVSSGCNANFEIDERGPLHTGKGYLKTGNDTCEIYSGLEPYHFFDLGPAHPFSEFPTATLVRDP